MHYKKSFPSRFLQATDLDTPIDVTINSVNPAENVASPDQPEQLKPVARFEEDVKPCVLNLTRAEAIAEVAGDDDMDRWRGVRVRLSQGTTRFGGKKVACIVVSASTQNPKSGAPLTQKPKLAAKRGAQCAAHSEGELDTPLEEVGF